MSSPYQDFFAGGYVFVAGGYVFVAGGYVLFADGYVLFAGGYVSLVVSKKLCKQEKINKLEGSISLRPAIAVSCPSLDLNTDASFDIVMEGEIVYIFEAVSKENCQVFIF